MQPDHKALIYTNQVSPLHHSIIQLTRVYKIQINWISIFNMEAISMYYDNELPKREIKLHLSRVQILADEVSVVKANTKHMTPLLFHNVQHTLNSLKVEGRTDVTEKHTPWNKILNFNLIAYKKANKWKHLFICLLLICTMRVSYNLHIYK